MKNKKINCIDFKNSIDGNSQELYFYGDIVADAWCKWTETDTCPEDIIEILKYIDDSKPLDIFINSGGGNVFAGLAIYNMLKRNKAQKIVHVEPLAGSIASVIAMVGDKIIMPTNAFLMIHKPYTAIEGNANDLRKLADNLDKIEEGIISVYNENLANGADIEEIKQLVNDETWLTATQASKYFNVELVESNKAVASISNLSNYKNVPQELLNRVNNKANDDSKQLEFLKVKLQLELI